MLARGCSEVIEIGHGYDGEVIYGLARLGVPAASVAIAREAHAFLMSANAALATNAEQLAHLHKRGCSVAIWGGTGKSAAFMQRYHVDAERFPIVVDSDPQKAGSYVPGTGQEIRLRDWLLEHPAEVVIIPPQWRAADIVVEMEQTGIRPTTVLIEHGGCLIDFHRDAHPYVGRVNV